MKWSEYDKLYVLKDLNTGKIIYKYPYEKNKLVYAQRGRAQKALTDMLKWNPGANISIEEITL